MRFEDQITLAVLIVISIFVFSFVYNSIVLEDNNLFKKEVKINTIFGCLPLEQKYTDEEWTAKENLDKAVFGYKLERCE